MVSKTPGGMATIAPMVADPSTAVLRFDDLETADETVAPSGNIPADMTANLKFIRGLLARHSDA